METKSDSNKSFNTPEVKLHFLDYWRIIRIRKTVILAVFLLVTITTAVVTFILPKTYESTVKMKVNKDAPDIDGVDSHVRYYTSAFDPFFVATEFETIQSKSVLYRVIQNLDLNRRWAEKMKVQDLRQEVTYAILRKSIDVRQNRNTSIMEIRAYSNNATEAAEIANEVARVYKATRIDSELETTTNAIAILQNEWNERDARVKELQSDVDELKVMLGITDFEDQQGSMMYSGSLEPEAMSQAGAQRILAQSAWTKADTIYQSLTNLSPVELKRAVPAILPDPHLDKLIQSLSESEQRLAVIAQSFAPGHPDMKALNAVIETINSQIDAKLDGIIQGAATSRQVALANLEGLDREVARLKTNAIEIAVARRPYWVKKRELEEELQVRVKLSYRITQARVNADLPRSGVVIIIENAEPSNRAVKPNKVVNITLGILVGLAVGIGLAFFIEYLDTSVKTIDDVERALQAPVLGVIPQNVGSLIEEGPDSPHAEAYRVLRTNILFSQKDPKLNTITVVSGGAGEGKSTTIFNLSAIFAQNGHRVLIVDSDLRRPSIHKLLRVSNSIGLTNYLLKQNSLEEVIQTTPLPTLDFLPSGKLPSSSMGVLSSTQMKELIRDLKRRYDYVFFDSPPIMGVSDASILASEVDSVLQVIQYRRYPQPMTIRAKQMIEKVGGNLLGIVLNNINMASDENYYYYSGYYYDYYSKQDDDGEVAKPDPGSTGSPEAEPGVEIKPKY